MDLEAKIVVHLIPTLGSLSVYTFQTHKEIMLGTLPKEIYWRDAGSPQGYGPFPTIYAALTHYKCLVLLSNNTDTSIQNNLIRIDFATKKRVLIPIN